MEAPAGDRPGKVGETIDQNTWQAVAGRLRAGPYVQHIALVGGGGDILMLVRTPDNATLGDVVLAQAHAVVGILASRTWLVLDEV